MLDKILNLIGMKTVNSDDVIGSDSFDKIGGYDQVKKELSESIERITNTELKKAYPLKADNILLFGPSGCGKTFLIKALAKKLRFGFYLVHIQGLLSSLVGETEKNIGELFVLAGKNSPSILFFDQIELLATKRELDSDDLSHRISSAFLSAFDEKGSELIIIGATTEPYKIDHAFFSKHRFNKLVYVKLPEQKDREEIFKICCSGLPSKNINFKRLAKITNGYTGAEIKKIIENAKLEIAKKADMKGEILPLTTNLIEKNIETVWKSVSAKDVKAFENFAKAHGVKK